MVTLESDKVFSLLLQSISFRGFNLNIRELLFFNQILLRFFSPWPIILRQQMTYLARSEGGNLRTPHTLDDHPEPF